MAKKGTATEFRDISGRRLNHISNAVSRKIPKNEAGLESAAEKKYYDALWKEAVAHEKKYNFWPTFATVEIESDDPCLDIYGNQV